jgi:hypothetical protein
LPSDRPIVLASPCTMFTLYSLSAELSIHLSIHQVLGNFRAGMKVDMSPVTVLGFALFIRQLDLSHSSSSYTALHLSIRYDNNGCHGL